MAPVFKALAAHAAKICEASDVRIFLAAGEIVRYAAGFGDVPIKVGVFRLNRGSAVERSIIDRLPVHIQDTQAESAKEYSLGREIALKTGWRTVLAVPLIRKNTALGGISLRRRQVRPFTDKQITLLKTFADQAVIAIENVRLFNETKEALERQTATAEILRVISSSPTDTQPVFEAIVQSGLNLFPNAAIVVTLPDGDRIRLAAIADADPLHAAQWKQRHQFPLTREYMHAVAILDRMVIDVPDAQAYEGGPLAAGIRNFLATGNRAITIMPMLRADAVIGTISVIRLAPGPLTEKQFSLLRTFADQAVIAIENVRLFKELESRTEALTRSVGQLTALGEVGHRRSVRRSTWRRC
ncbi:MAG: GAF domain-containing protein [Betaproteobacteria bacterium]|nr:GAF domain-containing protein [Betaproteobacteria bacterium]